MAIDDLSILVPNDDLKCLVQAGLVFVPSISGWRDAVPTTASKIGRAGLAWEEGPLLPVTACDTSSMCSNV